MGKEEIIIEANDLQLSDEENIERDELINRDYKLAINGSGFFIIDEQALASIGISKEALEDIKLNPDKNVKNVIFVPTMYHEEDTAIVYSVDIEHDDKILTSLIIEPAEIEESPDYEVQRVDKIDYIPGEEIVEIDTGEAAIKEIGIDISKKIRQTPRAKKEKKNKTGEISGIPTNAGRYRTQSGGSKVDSIKKLPTPLGLIKAGKKGGKKGGEGMKRKAKLKEEIERSYHKIFVLGDEEEYPRFINLIELKRKENEW